MICTPNTRFKAVCICKIHSIQRRPGTQQHMSQNLQKWPLYPWLLKLVGIGYFKSNEINNTSTYPLICANIYPSGLNKIVKKGSIWIDIWWIAMTFSKGIHGPHSILMTLVIPWLSLLRHREFIISFFSKLNVKDGLPFNLVEGDLC